MKKSDFGIIILSFGVILVFLGAPLSIFLGNIEKTSNGSTQISKTLNELSEVDIYNLVSGGDIYLKEMNIESLNIIESSWEITYTGLSLPENSLSITHMIKGSTLIVYISTPININIRKLNITIFFNPDYTYSIMSNTHKANVNFDAYNIHFKKFDFKTSSGDLNIKLNCCSIREDFRLSSGSGGIRLMLDYVNFSKDFICQSNTGVQLFDLWNIRFESVADCIITSNTGYIRLYWANHYNKSQNVNINVYSNFDIRVKLWCPIEIMRSQISLFTNEGNIVFTRNKDLFHEINENVHQTEKINDLSLDSYNISATSYNGETLVQHVSCFKWSRICDWTQDFLQYNVKKSGNYSLYRIDHDISTINFFNTKYTYLNESRYLNINFEPLAVSSEKLFYVDWQLEYIHAMGIGVGDLNILLTQKEISGILNSYLKLDFRIDKILPTFVNYNITVYYHPNYTFNQYLIS